MSTSKGISETSSILRYARGKAQKKNVHWDPSIQDTENKSKPRKKSIVPNQKTPTAAKVVAAQRTAPASKQDSSDIGLSHSKANMQGSSFYRSPSPRPHSRTSWSALNSQYVMSTSNPTVEAIQSPTIAGPSRQWHPNQVPGHPITTAHPTHHEREVYVPTKGGPSTSQPLKTYRPNPVEESAGRPERRLAQANTSMKVPTYRPQQPVLSQARPTESTTQKASSSTTPNHGNKKRPGKPQVVAPANTGAKRAPNPTAQRVSGRDPGQRNMTSGRALPTCPDPPTRGIGMRGGELLPPPTPRPERLPTPDLPDMGGEGFCDCDGCIPGRQSQNKAPDRSNVTFDLDVTVSKTNFQLQAAWAYIQDSRSGKM